MIPAIMLRNPDDTFRFVHADPIVPEGLSVETVAERLAKALEGFISRYPTQWFIFYRFWDIEQDLAVTHGQLAATLHPADSSVIPGGKP